MLEDFQCLACSYADMQRKAASHMNKDTLRQHITHTLQRCLPSAAVKPDMVNSCLLALQLVPDSNDPMRTGAIHAYAGQYLLASHTEDDPLLQRLHRSAKRLLPGDISASRDDLRLVSLDALYQPGILPPGIYSAYIHHRLGLHTPRLSCEEIAIRMHKSLIFIHELDAAILTLLSTDYAGGSHA